MPPRPDDVVADTFATAWRRLDQVPAGPAARLYLFAVAARVLANAQRGQARRERLLALLGRQPAGPQAADPAQASAEVATVRAAIARLPARQREVLTLVAWDGLDLDEAAQVLGCRRGAAQASLSRARRRLRELLDAPEFPAPRGASHASRSR